MRTAAGTWRGIALAAALAAAGMLATRTLWAERLGLSALTLSIVFGIIAGNSFFPAIACRAGPGVDYAKSTMLRVGIVLFGLRITFQQIGAVGWPGVIVDVVMVSLTFLLALLVGTRLLGLDRHTSILIGAGSALCGAAAVMATEPVVRAQAHKVSVAVATVVVFGTLGMFTYPLAYPYLHLSQHAYGVYAGSTIHEVAQVVAAARSVSEAAADAAVIEKMLRIMLLAPFLLILSGWQREEAAEPRATVGGSRQRAGGTERTRSPGRRITIPWFAVLFIAASAVNSLHLVPARLLAVLIQVDTVLLATAMAALGLRTHAGAIRQAGMRPLLLAAALFGFLVVGGYGINRAVTVLLS